MAGRGRPKGSGKKVTKKPTSKPWEGGENPWTEDVFKLPNKHSGFHACFVGKSDTDKFISQGYVFAKPEDYGIIKSEESDKGVANRIYRKDTVLLELANHLYKMRTDYFRGITDRQLGDSIKGEPEKASRDAHGGIEILKSETTLS